MSSGHGGAVTESVAKATGRYHGLVERMVAAALLDRSAYAEISADASANGQAFLVVVLAGIFNGLGLVGRLGTWGISTGVSAVVFGWFVWTAVIFVIGRLLGLRQDDRSLLRAAAFTNTPSLLLVLGIVPGLGPVVLWPVVAWQLAATAVAVQAVFEVGRWRAVAISLAALLVYLLAGAGLSYWADEGAPSGRVGSHDGETRRVPALENTPAVSSRPIPAVENIAT
jgi:Yip1-like protein